jgi:AcrR family transcriptional regulator
MEATRDRLVESAVRLFHEQGYTATGISTILREAQVNSGSLYHFFSGKKQLLIAVLRWYEEHLWPVVLAPVVEAEPDPIERIFRLLTWYRDFMKQSGCQLGCPVGNLALEIRDSDGEARELIDLNLRNWSEGILAWLQEAGDRLPASCDLEALSRFVLTVMEGGLLQARAAGSLDAFDSSVRVLRDYFDRLQAPASDAPEGTPL